jgi:hypothetical protein
MSEVGRFLCHRKTSLRGSNDHLYRLWIELGSLSDMKIPPFHRTQMAYHNMVYGENPGSSKQGAKKQLRSEAH